jgi:DNA-binding LacI/PurR family transcriptional regulator
MQAVLNHGYRKVVYLDNYTDLVRDLGTHYSQPERKNAVEQSCQQAGVELVLDQMVSWAADPFFKLPLHLLRPDTAIVCYSHGIAMTLDIHAARAGKIAGRDFGLASCDDSAQMIEYSPHICRTAFDRYTLGKTTARMVATALQSNQPQPSVRLKDSLHIGSTLARVGPAVTSASSPEERL